MRHIIQPRAKLFDINKYWFIVYFVNILRAVGLAIVMIVASGCGAGMGALPDPTPAPSQSHVQVPAPDPSAQDLWETRTDEASTPADIAASAVDVFGIEDFRFPDRDLLEQGFTGVGLMGGNHRCLALLAQAKSDKVDLTVIVVSRYQADPLARTEGLMKTNLSAGDARVFINQIGSEIGC